MLAHTNLSLPFVLTQAKTMTLLLPVENGKKFPYIVIEYFKQELEERPGDTILRMKGDSPSRTNLESVYDFEKQRFSQTTIKVNDDDHRIYSDRWKHIHKIIVIEPSPTQTYFSLSLDHPHYSVHPIEYQSFESNVIAFQRKNGGLPHLHFCPNTSNHFFSGVAYCNQQL
jgi:ATP sulfurylase